MDATSPRHLKIASWAILAVLTMVGWLAQGLDFALGVVAGGLLAVLNFHVLHYLLRQMVKQAQGLSHGEAGRAKTYFAVRQLVRYVLLLAIICYLVGSGRVNIFGLLLGLSTVVLTLMLAAVTETFKLKKKEANPSHGTSHSVS
jgi:hypothetical protein